MSTNTGNNPSSISQRKQDHIDVCRKGSGHGIEMEAPCGFESLQFIHTALPELSCDEISTEINFLGKSIRFPLFISCMTGGTEEGYRANYELAKAAQEMKLPIGLGSMRVLLTEPDRVKDFSMRKYAPDVPIMGNIGAVQLRDTKLEDIKRLIQQQHLDALVIHLNCGQELFQTSGDRDFRGLKQTISQAVNNFELPIIVKETGFGIRPSLVKELVEMGVAYIDVAGSGGTNWILVEKGSHQSKDFAAEEFSSWGNGTAILLGSLHDFPGKILASGGLRSGMDIAKSIALGAVAGGMALPFIRSALEGGAEAVCRQISEFERVLKSVMALTGSKDIIQLRKSPLLKSPTFEHYTSSLKAIDFTYPNKK